MQPQHEIAQNKSSCSWPFVSHYQQCKYCWAPEHEDFAFLPFPKQPNISVLKLAARLSILFAQQSSSTWRWREPVTKHPQC